MLLEQPAEIRGALRSLPGGGLLQDYIDDLESKAGIVSEQPAAAPVEMADEEVAKAKILATALAEAQLQATVKMQQTQPQPRLFSLRFRRLRLRRRTGGDDVRSVQSGDGRQLCQRTGGSIVDRNSDQ